VLSSTLNGSDQLLIQCRENQKDEEQRLKIAQAGTP
jgi:hypothetical protein